MKRMILFAMLIAWGSPSNAQSTGKAGTIQLVTSYGTAFSHCGTTNPCPPNPQSTNVEACEGEVMQVSYTPSSFNTIYNQWGYQNHYIEFTNVADPTDVHTFGLFQNNTPQAISLPPGTYNGQARYFSGVNSIYEPTNFLHVTVHSTTVDPVTLSAGPYCVNEPISVVSERAYSNSHYSNIRVDMGDGIGVLTPNDFGHMGPISWNRVNQNYTYTQPGTYTITTTYDYHCGNLSGTRSNTQTIVVGPTPSFVIPATVCANQEVAFENTTNCPAAITPGTVNWDFGDGGRASKMNPTYAYSDAGEYDVTLSFTVNGTSYSTTQTIQVIAAPETNLGPDQIFCSNGLFSFPVLDAGQQGDDYVWTYNGAVIAGQNSSTLQTSNFGTYCVRVTNAEGCTATDCMKVLEQPAFAPINPDFDHNPVGLWCEPFKIRVTPHDQRSGISHQFWVYETTSAGQTSGGTQYGPFTNPNGNLPFTIPNFTFLPDHHYYIKHGQWSTCDGWVEHREPFTYTCAQLNDGEEGLVATSELEHLYSEEYEKTQLASSGQTSAKPSDLQVYPNPTNGILNLSGLSGAVEVAVVSIDGKVVRSNRFVNSDQTHQLNLSDLTPGLYMIRATDQNNHTQTKRVILK